MTAVEKILEEEEEEYKNSSLLPKLYNMKCHVGKSRNLFRKCSFTNSPEWIGFLKIHVKWDWTVF